MRPGTFGLLATGLLMLCLPSAAAQGGSGEVKVWVESTVETVQVPADGSPVDVPLTFRGRVSNTTCPQATKFTVDLIVEDASKTPLWANYSFQPNRNVTFQLEGDYRYLQPNAEVKSTDQRSIRLQWPLAPSNSTWIYRINTGTPVRIDGNCYFAPVLKPQTPWRLGAYLEGGQAPTVAPTVAPATGPTNETSVVPSSSAEGKSGGNAASPGFVWIGLVLAALVAWRRR
jgi:hypothetical protein